MHTTIKDVNDTAMGKPTFSLNSYAVSPPGLSIYKVVTRRTYLAVPSPYTPTQNVYVCSLWVCLVRRIHEVVVCGRSGCRVIYLASRGPPYLSGEALSHGAHNDKCVQDKPNNWSVHLMSTLCHYGKAVWHDEMNCVVANTRLNVFIVIK